MTVREFISVIRGSLDSLTIDDRVPSALIYNTSISIAQLIIKREAETRKIFNSPELFSYLGCVTLSPVEGKKCGGIPIPCSILLKSDKPLPKSYLSNSGSIVIVKSVDGEENFNQTSPSKYSRISKREFISDDVYFWIGEDQHLYIPDRSIRAVDVYILALSNHEVDKFNGNECSKLLDSTLSIPGYLVDPVINETIKKLIPRKEIQSDENSNQNGNLK